MSVFPQTKMVDITTLVTDGKHGDCVNSEGSGYFFLSSKDLRDGRLHYDNPRQITYEGFIETHRRTNLEPGDILLTNCGASIGRVGIAQNDPRIYRTTFQKSISVIKANKSIVDKQYLYYFLLCNSGLLVRLGDGTAQPNLLIGDIKRILVSVPKRSTQCKIASILSAYDDLIENNTRRIAILEAMAQATYREWLLEFRFPGHEKIKLVNSPLGKIPEGWKPTRLGDLAEEVRRGVDPSQVDSETPYFGLEHLPRKSITLCDWGHARDVQSTKLVFRQGEILFGKIRPYFHKVGVAPVDGVCSSDAIVISPKTEGAFGPVLCCVSSEDFVSHATQTSQGTKMPRANWDVLTKYALPTPQGQLLDEFNDSIRDIVATLRLLMLKNRNLRKTRDLLLPKLISGQLDVEDLDIDIDTGDPVAATAALAETEST